MKKSIHKNLPDFNTLLTFQMNINGISSGQYTLNTEHIPSKTRSKNNKKKYKYMTFYGGSL